MKSVAVIGSLNIDHILKVDRLPETGETIPSNNYIISEGGKGANQAASLGKLGLDVHFFGKIGNDEYSNFLLKSLQDSCVNTQGILVDNLNKTGSAFITVDKSGNNMIILASGANGAFSFTDLQILEDSIFKHDIVLLQMEIPEDINNYIIKKAKELNKLILLNLAPAKTIDNKILNLLDYLIINETEMEFLTKIKYTNDNLEAEIAELRKIYNNKLVVTLGPHGAAYSVNNNITIIPTFDVKTVDKTAAGDAFIGGFIFGLANGFDFKNCMILGNATGAIATTTIGAQKSLPEKKALKEFLFKNGLKLKL